MDTDRNSDAQQDAQEPDGLVNHYWGFDDTVVPTPGGGIRARSQEGGFAQHWWAGRWLRALTHWIDASRLERGRVYARAGQVTALVMDRGVIRGRVQGTAPEPYSVELVVNAFADEEWEAVLGLLSSRALYAAQLLNGEMPGDIDSVFAGIGLSLFPRGASYLEASCDCPDSARPCKHAVALLMLVAEGVDENPFLLFALRGRTEDEVLEGLRSRRAGFRTQVLPDGTEPEEEDTAGIAEPLDARLDDFWAIGPQANSVHVRVEPPEIPLEVLRILGDLELGSEASLAERLEQVYAAVSQHAMEVAFGDGEPEDAGQDAGAGGD